MYTVKAIYDGTSFKPTEPISVTGEHEVAIVFIKPLDADSDGTSSATQVKKRPMSELRGILKGKVWMSDDFDEPLEEMKEYME